MPFTSRTDRRTRHDLALAWAEWVERAATSGPRPFRVLFEAELGFEAWAGPWWGRQRSRWWSRRAAARSLAAAHLRAARRTLRAVAAGAVARARLTGTDEGNAALLAAHPDGSRVSVGIARLDVLAVTRSLLAVTMVLTMLGVAAASTLQTGGRSLLVDRLAGGAFARTEAIVPAVAGAPEPGVAGDAPPGGSGTAPAAAAPPAPAPPAIPAQRGALPVGKGMWIWHHDRAEGGDPAAIVARAKATGLTHLYVRTGTLREGFVAGPFLDRLLPRAHAAQIRVFAWDFPYLNDVGRDVARAVQAITYTTPDGHRVDGYAADIELRSMGVNVTPQTATEFGSAVRRAVGPLYPLVACVPRPSPALVTYPFAEVVAHFDAIAPMVYWLGRDPAQLAADAVRQLSVYGKPVMPVGQAYDGSAEGGPVGVPPRDELLRFMQAAEAAGATGVSWWSWQHADQQAWDGVRDAPQFTLPVAPAPLSVGHIRAYQTLLASLGFSTPLSGVWNEALVATVVAYQKAARLPMTGVIDEATRAVLLSPFAPPITPQG